MKKKDYVSYDEAKKLVHPFGITTSADWFRKRRENKILEKIPHKPHEYYKKQGIAFSWGEFLGTGKLSPLEKRAKFASIEDFSKFLKNNKITSIREFREFIKKQKRPENIPANPDQVYKSLGTWPKGGFGELSGTGTIAPQNRVYKTIEESRKYASSLNIKTRREWIQLCKDGKIPDDVPADPYHQYKEEWKGWGYFLGTGAIAPHRKKSSGVYLSFTDARSIVHTLGIESKKEWGIYCKSDSKNERIPADPVRVYKEEWKNWGDWLGTGTVASQNVSKNYLSIEKAKQEARLLAKKYNIQTLEEWFQAHKEGKIPSHLPRDPGLIYHRKRKKK